MILIGVLVLLLILYFALSTWNKKQDSKEEETVKVTDLKTSEITGVKYDLGTVSYTHLDVYKRQSEIRATDTGRDRADHCMAEGTGKGTF